MSRLPSGPVGEGGLSRGTDECAAIEARLNERTTDTDRETEHVYWHVLLALRRWIDGSEKKSERIAERSLRRSIRRDLRAAGHPNAADSVLRPKRTGYCDIVVNGRIGVKIVHNLTRRSREWMHKQLRSLLQEYDYLVLYGHQISAETIDVWRQLKRSLLRSSRDGQFHALRTLRRRQGRSPRSVETGGIGRELFAVWLLAAVGITAVAGLIVVEDVMVQSVLSLIALASVVVSVCCLLLVALR
ncbi:hypothetical protein [Natronococcus roseus]|uniref:hypothetical protein n=1 Tax=Natronococcus roseus TaxID=1052014 RepID=UPI00374D7CB8